MKELKLNKVDERDTQKREWEPPKLIVLGKDKTEGGFRASTYEDSTYTNPS